MVHINYLKNILQSKLKPNQDNVVDNKLYHYLKPTGSSAPRFYGQPKIHKPAVPIRPIV